MRTHFKKSKFVSTIVWTVEMDALLIERNSDDLQTLVTLLNVPEIEISERRRVLGLTRRIRQFRKTL